jgi:hypothetical protein
MAGCENQIGEKVEIPTFLTEILSLQQILFLERWALDPRAEYSTYIHPFNSPLPVYDWHITFATETEAQEFFRSCRDVGFTAYYVDIRPPKLVLRFYDVRLLR